MLCVYLFNIFQNSYINILSYSSLFIFISYGLFYLSINHRRSLASNYFYIYTNIFLYFDIFVLSILSFYLFISISQKHTLFISENYLYFFFPQYLSIYLIVSQKTYISRIYLYLDLEIILVHNLGCITSDARLVVDS